MMARIEMNIKGGYAVTALIPDLTAKEGRRSFPVLWLFPDAGQNHTSWPDSSRIELFAQAEGAAVICMGQIKKDEDRAAVCRWLRAVLPLSEQPGDHYAAGLGTGKADARKALQAAGGFCRTFLALETGGQTAEPSPDGLAAYLMACIRKDRQSGGSLTGGGI